MKIRNLVTALYTTALITLTAAAVPPSPVKAQSGAARLKSPTYAADVAPILRAKCERCHHAGEVAPFSLIRYEDARKRATQIAEVTQSRLMPPWKAEHGYGSLAEEAKTRLTDRELATIKQWASLGAPMGDRKLIPPPIQYRPGWHIGEPDLVIGPDREFTLAAEGQDVYRHFVIQTNFPEDRYVKSVEVHPGNRAVVHHVIAYIDGKPMKSGRYASDVLAEKSKDGQPGYDQFGGPGFDPTGWLAGWAPGNQPAVVPDGLGIYIPKGARICLEVHYHKDGKVEKDRSQVGLIFCNSVVDKQIDVQYAVNFWFKIPPGDSRYEATATKTISEDMHVWAVSPHMHLLGKEMKVWAELPDGTSKPLVWIKKWDFNWQLDYALTEPVALPKGTKVRLTAYFDNSSANPRHPTPKNLREVGWGESTTDEMCIAFMSVTRDGEHLNHTPVKVTKQTATSGMASR